MCAWGINRPVTLAYQMLVSGRTEVDVDACLAPLIQALNDAGVQTVGCCCGHGRGQGSVLIQQDARIIELRLTATCSLRRN